jgi:ATP-dependent Clp protease, protease subunit
MTKTLPEMTKDRRFILNSIDDANAKELIEGIKAANLEDDVNEEIYKDYVREPLELVITSYGGSVYDGLAIIAAMRESRTPINTQAFGPVMSMGLPIFVHGDVRTADKYATFMYHDVSSVLYGKVEDMEMDLKEAKRLRQILNGIICDHTSLSKTELNGYIKTKTDWYFDSAFALKRKICTEVF